MFHPPPVLHKRRPRVEGNAIVIGEAILVKRTPHGFDYRIEAPPEPVWIEMLAKAYGRSIKDDDAFCKIFAQAMEIFRFDPQRADALLATLAPAPITQDEIDLPSTPDFCATLRLCKDGVALGEGVIIAPLEQRPSGAIALAIDGREEEIYALLCVASGRLLPPDGVRKFHAASKALESGNSALAAIHLAQSGAPPLRDQRLAKALTHAKQRLEKGASPFNLLQKFNPNHDERGRFAASSGERTPQGDQLAQYGRMAGLRQINRKWRIQLQDANGRPMAQRAYQLKAPFIENGRLDSEGKTPVHDEAPMDEEKIKNEYETVLFPDIKILPSFKTLDENWIGSGENNENNERREIIDSRREVANKVGGPVGASVHAAIDYETANNGIKTVWSNTCAIRASRAFNEANSEDQPYITRKRTIGLTGEKVKRNSPFSQDKIRYSPGSGKNKNLITGAQEFEDYLTVKYPDSKPLPVIAEHMYDFPRVKGITSFPVTKPTFASGHIDLFNGSGNKANNQIFGLKTKHYGRLYPFQRIKYIERRRNGNIDDYILQLSPETD